MEEYDGIHQRYESNPGLGRRQSYPRHPAALASNTSHTNFERAFGSYDDRRYSDESVHGAGGQRRVSFPAAKVRFYLWNFAWTVVLLGVAVSPLRSKLASCSHRCVFLICILINYWPCLLVYASSSKAFESD